MSPKPLPELDIESLDHDAQGVGHSVEGKVVFVEGALTSERVSAIIHRSKNQWEQGTLQAVLHESSQRVKPHCPHFGLHAGACGGCKMQHLHPMAQLAVKQRVMEDNLWHLGKVKPERILRPIQGPDWGYRYRARLSVRWVQKKGEVLVGFHERKSRYVADMQVCPVLPPQVSAMLLPLRALLGGMQARSTCPQIELAGGDRTTALVLRHLEPLSPSDVQALRDFALQHGVEWWLQPKGPDTVHRLDNAASELFYALPEFGIQLPFKPTDFTQVNPRINRVLVQQALQLLDVQGTERVIDWFCGLGNFTLPLATLAADVLGVEGSAALVQRAHDNLGLQPIRLAPTRFVARNLFEMTAPALVQDGVADKWLMDPPREGAFALSKALADAIQNPAEHPGWRPPQRIVYVSCNPATLARDAGLLVNVAGYRCTAAGVVNMFPHTAHVESMAVFDRMPPSP